MKKAILIFAAISFLCFLSKISYAQTPDWLWAKSAEGMGSDYAYSIAVDASGNTYVAGYFNSPTLSFGSDTLTNTSTGGSGYDVFLAKYDANGNVLWTKSASGTIDDYAYSVAVDDSGNIYVAGFFESSTLSFGSTTLTNAGDCNIFLAKYDANGIVLWAKSAGGTYYDWAPSVAVDDSGNAYLTGCFYSPTITFGFTILTNAGSSDIFLAKYDANGNILWAKSAGGTDEEVAYSVAVDASGNTYLAGYFESLTLTFGSDTLTNVDRWDMFLAKYDATGNVLWAKSAGGTSYDVAYSVAVDTSGNTYVAGYFSSFTISFGSTTLTNVSVGYADIFLVKYDASGNVLWAKSAGGASEDEATSVSVDASGNTYLAGYFWSPTITFGSTTLTNVNVNNYTDIFLAKYDANGNVLWAKSAGGTNYDEAYSVAVDTPGNTYVAGWFYSPTLIFGSTTLTNAGGYDMFLAKLAAFTVITAQTNVSCYGGNNGTATANAAGGGTSPFTYLWNTTPAQTTQTATGLAAGSYIVTVTDANGASSTASVTIIQPSALNISTSGNIIICKDSNTTICVYAIGGVSPYQYLWSNSSATSCQTVSPVNTTNYSATVTDACTATSSTLTVTVDSASKPTITQNGNMLFSTAASAYQWNLNGNPINGATGQMYAPLVSGMYSVTVANANGCSATSDTISVVVTGLSDLSDNKNIYIYPNPA
ncbi:MAG: SBBP repeat-containing protein, partial [Bacteroidales bacterium]